MTRLFAGLGIPEHIVQKFNSLKVDIPGLRWQKPENFHITLSFIGEVEADMAEKIESALHDVRATPFQLSLNGIGTFSRRNEPKVLWAGVSRENALLVLKEKIDPLIKAVGVPLDKREYLPHVTLASMNRVDRIKLDAFLKEHRDFTLPVFEVSEFILYRSIGTKDGQIYKSVSSYRLS